MGFDVDVDVEDGEEAAVPADPVPAVDAVPALDAEPEVPIVAEVADGGAEVVALVALAAAWNAAKVLFAVGLMAKTMPAWQ